MIKRNEELLGYLKEALALSKENEKEAGTSNIDTGYITGAIQVVTQRIAYLKKNEALVPPKAPEKSPREQLLAMTVPELLKVAEQTNKTQPPDQQIPTKGKKEAIVNGILLAHGYTVTPEQLAEGQ